MKLARLFLVLMIALVAIGMVPSSVSAQKFSYTTGVNVQNLSGTVADITIEFFNSGGTDGSGGASAVTPVTDQILAFGVKNYFPLSAVAAGFNGSVVISSNQPVAAVTNVSNSDLSALGAYNGAATGATTVYLPILHKANSGFDTWYSVQNAGSQTAQVSIDYSSTGAGVDRTVQIAPNASVMVAQKDETMHGANRIFAATLTSTNAMPLVVVVLQENTNNIMAYTGFSAGSLTPVMPTINMNNSGYFTGTQIYNLGDAATNVTVSYKSGAFGTDCTETKTIAAKTMVIFTSGAFTTDTAGETCVAGQRFLGSGRVTTNSASQNLAVVVNQLRAPSNVNGSSYSGFDPAKATSTVFMPTIFDRNSFWYTAFNLMNVGAGTTFVKCTYAASAITTDTGAAGLASGSSVTMSQNNVIGDKYVGSAICKAYTSNAYTTEDTTAGKILTVVNELGRGSRDNLLSYEGINP